jgi:hypothetical protein
MSWSTTAMSNAAMGLDSLAVSPEYSFSSAHVADFADIDVTPLMAADTVGQFVRIHSDEATLPGANASFRVALATPQNQFWSQNFHPVPADSIFPSSASTTAAEDPLRAWMMIFLIVMLIAYQLRRRHRSLRPHRFTV